MKRLDLHIHTISTISDSQFSFSIEDLKRYIIDNSIHGIAITNHNCFDMVQYQTIQKELQSICVVLPGIEINLAANGNKKFGHMLCIADIQDLNDFSDRTKKIEQKIQTKSDSISYQELIQIFPDLGKYLWIPHLSKDPEISDEILHLMSDHIVCGEVKSPKQFVYSQRISSLTPVYFSDSRPGSGKAINNRTTCVDINFVDVTSLKIALSKMDRVSLTEREGHRFLEIKPEGFCISTGLTLVCGKRASGKTYLLDKLNERLSSEIDGDFHVKYIRQFSLTSSQKEHSVESDFASQKNKAEGDFREEYLSELVPVVNEVKRIDISADEKTVEQFLQSLKQNAEERDRQDAYAKCKMFDETLFELNDLKNLEKIIQATEVLLDSTQYKPVIEKHIERSSLLSLYKELVEIKKRDSIVNNRKEVANTIIGQIKNQLQNASAVTPIDPVDLSSVWLNKKKVLKFNKLVDLLKVERELERTEIEGFKIVVRREAFKGALGLKKVSGKQDVHFKAIFPEYENNPYAFLRKLREMPSLDQGSLHKFFVSIPYEILNQYGQPVSGGERAEYNLLQSINGASKYDLVLIDEPESSFDNPFLFQRFNKLLNQISKNTPVVITTHNNTVGVSLNPDFVVYTECEISDGEPLYDQYSGLFSDKYLENKTGDKIESRSVLIEIMEAGEEAYNNRKNQYELLKNSKR